MKPNTIALAALISLSWLPQTTSAQTATAPSRATA
jgi:hypothetical protein